MIDPKTLKPGDIFSWNEPDGDPFNLVHFVYETSVCYHAYDDVGLIRGYFSEKSDSNLWKNAVIVSKFDSMSIAQKARDQKAAAYSTATDLSLKRLYDKLNNCQYLALELVTSLHLSGTDEELEADRAEDCTFKTVRELKDIIGRLRRFKERAYGDNDE